MRAKAERKTPFLRLNAYDCLLALGFLLLAASLLFLRPAAAKPGASVELRQGNELLGVYPLAEDRVIPVQSGEQQNLVVIEGGFVRVREANCPDQVCVRHRPVSQAGELIVWLPARLVIRVLGGEEADYDAYTG